MTPHPDCGFSITFLGGASSIGASCALVEAGGTRILIDCGVRLNSSSPLPDLSLLGTKSIDAVIVTHAHFDHTGALPVVTDSFAGAPVFASEPLVAESKKDGALLCAEGLFAVLERNGIVA